MTETLDHISVGSHSGEPGSKCTILSTELLIEHSLEGLDQSGEHDDIGEGESLAEEVVLTLETVVDGSSGVLDHLNLNVELVFIMGLVTEELVTKRVREVGNLSAQSNPLVNLSFLDGRSTSKVLITTLSSQKVVNGISSENSLLAIINFEVGEAVEGVLLLEFLALLLLFGGVVSFNIGIGKIANQENTLLLVVKLVVHDNLEFLLLLGRLLSGSFGSIGVLRLSFVLIGFHSWEQKNFLDVVVISEKHGKSINTETPTTGRRQTVFESGNIAIVDGAGLEITVLLGGSLSHESFELHLRVVKLSIGIDELLFVAEQLKTLSQTFLSSMPLGQGTHNLRVVSNECG